MCDDLRAIPDLFIEALLQGTELRLETFDFLTRFAEEGALHDPFCCILTWLDNCIHYTQTAHTKVLVTEADNELGTITRLMSDTLQDIFLVSVYAGGNAVQLLYKRSNAVQQRSHLFRELADTVVFFHLSLDDLRETTVRSRQDRRPSTRKELAFRVRSKISQAALA